VSGVSNTPETQSKYNLTGTLFLTAEALVVPKSDTRMYRGLDDIKGLNFATLRGSAYANYLKQVGIAGFKEFETTPAVLNAVSSGQANAAIFSGIIAGYLLKQGKFPDLQVVASYQPALARPIMAAFPKTATESFNKVNTSIQKLTADGTFRKILATYGQ
jgi:cystine transport system substrate-binding protein